MARSSHVEEKYFIHIMTLAEGPRTYGPFDTQGEAEDWARTHLAGYMWYCTVW